MFRLVFHNIQEMCGKCVVCQTCAFEFFKIIDGWLELLVWFTNSFWSLFLEGRGGLCNYKVITKTCLIRVWLPNVLPNWQQIHKFPSIHPVRCLLRLTSLNRYLDSCCKKMSLLPLHLRMYLLWDMEHFCKTYHFWISFWFTEFFQFSKSHLGKTQMRQLFWMWWILFPDWTVAPYYKVTNKALYSWLNCLKVPSISFN